MPALQNSMKTSSHSSKTNPSAMNIHRHKLYLPIPAVLTLAIMLVLTQIAGAAPTWNNAAGGNWSVGANWTPTTPPGSADNVIFGNTGVGALTTNNISSETINSLTYNQNNQTTTAAHTTVIPPGQTLTIASSVAAAASELYVGNTTTTVGEQVNAAIQGLNGTLSMTGNGDIWVMQGSGGGANGSQHANLDMSQLGTFNATIGRLLVGVNVNGVNRLAGSMLLAQTNNITLTSASIPQVEVGEATANGNSGSTVANNIQLNFGQTNNLFANAMRLGGDKCNVIINFAAAINSAPSLLIRAADGVSPCTVIDFSYQNGNGGNGTSGSCTADFSAGKVDILSSLVHITQGQPSGGTGTSTATVTLGAGIFNVADLEIGFGNAAGSNGGGTTTGTLNVNNNGLFPAGALVTCATVLNLAHTNGATGTLPVITGTLNINGGEVDANNITSGGGVSAITVNGGTLVVTNTAGTLTAPIGTFTMSGANLTIPALNTSASLNVKAISGSAAITISRIAPIGAYPASISIIHYQTDSGTTLTLAPGGLPAGYTGSLVDAGGGKVSLNLTAGPVADLTETWSGANSADWDFSSLNWLFHSLATNYFDTAVVIFNDSTTQTNISIDQPVSPNSITVNNNTLQYTFGGPGNIAGTASLIKSGSSSLTLDNSGGVNNISTIVINGGTLQIGAGDANGGISSVSITNNGALVFDRTNNVLLTSDIAGTGTLTQGGGGTLVLSGANTYNGATSLTNGTLELDQSSSGTGPVTTSAGTVLAGSGVVNGTVTVGGKLNPGPAVLGGMGTFTANGGLTLNSGSTLFYDLSAANPSISDTINVAGNLTANNNAITVSFDGPPSGGTYPLFTYTGSLSGHFNTNVVGTHFTVVVDTNTPGQVNLDVTGGSGSSLSWASTSDPNWDQTTANWLDLGTSLPSTFNNGDTVLFDDTSGVVTGITIPAGVNVAPTSITDTATNNNFVISGAGHITGSTGIIMSGLGTLEIDTANSFSGAVDVQAGTLKTGNGQALGTTAGGTTIENGATLDVDGQNLGGEAITISGFGVNGAGAIINSGSANFQTFRTLILAGDAAIGGSAEMEMNNGGGNATITGAFNLTKVGANILNLQNLLTVDAGLKNIDVQAGTLLFNGLTPSMGDPNFTNIVEAGATLAFGSDTIAWNKNFLFNGDGSTITLNNEGGAQTELDGPVVLNGVCVFTVGGTSLTITNAISGTGGILKNGASPMILSGPTTYTGDTTISGAALRLQGAADLSGSTNIIINAGSTLTVTGMVSSTFPLPNSHTLSGNGVISGALIANAGSTVSPAVTPASSPVGILTVSNSIVLNGTTIMQIDPANGTNDVLKSGLSTITYGGTLILTNISTPAAGNSFKLFNAVNSSSYLGSFTGGIVPATPGPGLLWDTSALNTSGTIKVKSAAPPKFSSITIGNGNVMLSGSNGVASNHYYVLTSTNLALAITNWTSLATNTFDVNGGFTFTNSLTPPVPQRFYLLQLPGN